MARKIIFLCGSPRKNGNTNTLARAVAESAKAAGAEVELIDVPSVKTKAAGCTSCYACQAIDEYRCVIDDELSDLVARLPEFDCIVMASPVYCWSYTAQLKALLDRTFSLCKFKSQDEVDTAFNKKHRFVLIATAGGGYEGNLELLETQAISSTSIFGLGQFESLLSPFTPLEEGKIAEDEQLMKKAAQLGKKLATE
jgi:multimeric flavodoxin WrbA